MGLECKQSQILVARFGTSADTAQSRFGKFQVGRAETKHLSEEPPRKHGFVDIEILRDSLSYTNNKTHFSFSWTPDGNLKPVRNRHPLPVSRLHVPNRKESQKYEPFEIGLKPDIWCMKSLETRARCFQTSVYPSYLLIGSFALEVRRLIPQ